MKTITAYAVVNKDGSLKDVCTSEETASYRVTITAGETVIKLTGEYDDTPKLKPCPFCGQQPRICDKKVIEHGSYGQSYDTKVVTCCNGIKTDIESWENRV